MSSPIALDLADAGYDVPVAARTVPDDQGGMHRHLLPGRSPA
jgi:hypothetical protein